MTYKVTSRRGVQTRAPRYAWGDPIGDAYTDARMDVVRESSDYKFPGPALTRAHALSAFYTLMRMAASENPANAGARMRDANEAAYRYRNAPIWNILQTAVDVTKSNAKQTSLVARGILAASVKTSTKTPTTSGKGSKRAETHAHADEAPSFDWTNPPTWAKVAGASVLGVLAIWAAWPQRRAAVTTP